MTRLENECVSCSCWEGNWDDETASLMAEQAPGKSCSQCLDTLSEETCGAGDSFFMVQAVYTDKPYMYGK